VPFGLRLEDAGGLAVHEQEVVGKTMAGSQLELAYRDTASGGQVHLAPVLDDPPCRHQAGVDLRPGLLLGSAGARAQRSSELVFM
jgi:hypothetical protein